MSNILINYLNESNNYIPLYPQTKLANINDILIQKGTYKTTSSEEPVNLSLQFFPDYIYLFLLPNDGTASIQPKGPLFLSLTENTYEYLNVNFIWGSINNTSSYVINMNSYDFIISRDRKKLTISGNGYCYLGFNSPDRVFGGSSLTPFIFLKYNTTVKFLFLKFI